jgi:hypothetical protein
VNGTGRRGCRRDKRLRGEGVSQIAVAPNGRAVFSVDSFSGTHGPRTHELLADGSVGRASPPAAWPHLYEGGDNPEALTVTPDGRVFVTGHSDGLFMYRPTRAPRGLEQVACWAYQRRGCFSTIAIAGSAWFAASAPDGRTLYLGGEGEGVITVRPPAR